MIILYEIALASFFWKIVLNVNVLLKIIIFSAHGHMLQRTIGSDGSVILVAYLSFPNECEFVVMKMHDGGSGGVRFSHISRIFGPQVKTVIFL